MTRTSLRYTKPKRFMALLKQRCPRCREGSIFTGWVTTREACPVCGLCYGREEGYFSGGMHLSFFLAAPVLAFIFLVLYQLFASVLTLVATLFVSYAVFLPGAVPARLSEKSSRRSPSCQATMTGTRRVPRSTDASDTRNQMGHEPHGGRAPGLHKCW